MPFKQLSLRKEDAVLKPDVELIDPHFWLIAHPQKGYPGWDTPNSCATLHFNADGDSAQSYTAVWDGGPTAGCVMQVYGNSIDMPTEEADRSVLSIGNARHPGVGSPGKLFFNIIEGCDGLTWGIVGKKIFFTHPPTTPGKVRVRFDPSGASNNYVIMLKVTTDYVAPPPEIGDLAFVSGADATWDDNEHINSLTFWVPKPAEAIRCVRKNMKQTSDGATFTFSASANVSMSPRDDYSFVTADISAVPETEGYYRCTVELAGAADSPKSINLPVYIDR